MSRAPIVAHGRLDHGPPVGVIDIGSNSVRVVVYEGLTRSPTSLFNEKALCGLGREVQSTGLLRPTCLHSSMMCPRPDTAPRSNYPSSLDRIR